ncbi:MAG TPA: RHS repeat-associated core domain-containing protein, partial [Thermoanaerobaculia bacterium]|nr:RHS repeat-associated core domain-containing protein [Thermoanaerobaculia bacterium]
MLTTNIVNSCPFSITVNGQSVAAAGGNTSIPFPATGVAIQVPGIGQVQVLEPGTEATGHDADYVKVVCGDWFSYWGYADPDTLTITFSGDQSGVSFAIPDVGTNIQIARSSPDNVFPAPAIYGEINHDNVNLFTGDVNATYPLGEISDGRLTFGVSVFYNSRSADMAAAALDNVFGGNGWKLLDYPKIAQEGACWYFLDGMSAHLLQAAPAGGGFVTGGDYHAWTFTPAAGNTSWTATDDRGINYILGNQATLASGRTVWHLSSITDSTRPQSVITVTYQGNAIASVTSSLGDAMTFAYDAGGVLTTVTYSVTPAGGGAAVAQSEIRLQCSAGTGIVTMQAYAPLPGGGSTPIDAGYVFQYTLPATPLTNSALSSVQTPLGAVMDYTYYDGHPLAGNGLSFPKWHPVTAVSNTPQPNSGVTKGLFYSFWSWAFDPTQTYMQFNLAKEYAGGVYSGIDDEAPEDPFGHTSYLFFSGQPAASLIQYSGDAATATDPAVTGRVYWRGNFKVERTKTMQLGQSVSAVGAWPGTLVPLALPTGALVTSVTCTATNTTGQTADIALDVENGTTQVQGLYQQLAGNATATVDLTLDSLGPLTAVRAWGYMPSTCGISTLNVTYVVPQQDPLLPPMTNIPHRRRVIISGASTNANATFTPAAPYTSCTAADVAFTGPNAAVTVTLSDANGNTVGSGTFQSDGGGTGAGTITLAAPATVAKLTVASTSANAALTSLTLAYLLDGQPVNDDALAVDISFAQNTFAIGRPGAASFARITTSATSIDDVEQSTSFAYGDDETLPYPVTITQTVVKPDQDGANSTVTTTRSITYAAQQYPALTATNNISPVVEVLDSSAVDSNASVVVAGSVTQWQQWPATSWDEWRQYRLQTADATNPFNGDPDANWLKTTEIVDRNARGHALKATTVAGLVSSTSYDAIYGERTVASFVNADVHAGECGYLGFEAYEAAAAWTTTNGSITANSAFTGFASYEGQNVTVSPASFTPRANVAYVVAAYVLLDAGATATIGFNDAGTWSGQQTISADPSQPGWRYVQAIFNTPTAQQLPCVSITSGAVDHVVFAPVDADFHATVWEWNKRRVVATIGANGEISRSYYDTTGQAIASATPGKSLSLIDQAYSSALGQLWFSGQLAYDSTVPNQSLAVRTPQDGTWDDFTSLTRGAFNTGSLTNLTMTGNHLLAAGANVSASAPGLATATVNPSAQDFVVCAEVMLPDSTAPAGALIGLTVSSGSSQLCFGINSSSLSLVDLGSGTVMQSVTLQQTPPSLVLTLVVRQGTNLYAYADGAFLFSQTLGVAAAGPIGLRTTWPGTTFYNFGLVSQPELSNSSQDGDGAEMQFIASANATSSSVTQSLYGGDLQLYAGRTLATSQNQASLAPVAGFAALDASNMTVNGSVTLSWPAAFNSAPFADSVQRFNDPALRPKSRGKGGIFTAGTKGAVSYSYGEDTDGFFRFANDELNTSVTTNPTGASIVLYSNRNGLLFGKARIDPATKTSLLTGYEYDDAFRRTAIYYPGAYSDPTTIDKSKYFRTYEYDFAGHLTQLDDSDSGQTQYAYDSAGRQRLMQDAAGTAANPPYSVYTKYDARGRALESGTWTGSVGDATQAQLDDASWPQQNNSVLRTFNWDVPNNGESNSIGQLTTAKTPDFELWYGYDQQGRAVSVIANATFLVAQLSLGYDDLGRLTSLAEPANGYDVVYAYDEQGRMISVGTAANPAAYATYSYGNGTVTESLLGGAVTRVYTQNALGDLESISDGFFSEKLFFETRADGTTGYLNGQIASATYGFTWNNAPNGYTVDYTYDAFGRLTVATNSAYPDGTIGTSDTPIGYDNNGNILSMTRGGNALAFNYAGSNNQLNSVGKGQAFVYDARGNVTSSPSLGITNIAYTPDDDRPTNVTTANATVQFLYDANGARVQRSTASTSIAYLRDPSGRVLVEKINSTTPSTVSYIYGLRGRIAMIAADGTVYALLTDHGNSTRAVVDPSGNVVAWFNYDAFGALLPSISNAGTLELRYLYCGAEWDADLQLYDFAARLYDPAVCRFYSPDPAHQFASPYIYSDNPISFEDPTGEWFGFDDLIATVGGAIIGGGLELAREAIAGESLSWTKIAGGAAIGAVVGEAALYTAGGSIFVAGGGVAGGSAIGAAASTVGYGMAVGAGVGAGVGAVTGGITHAVSETGRSLGADIGWGVLGGAVGGAQTGMVAAVVTPAVAAKWIGKPVAGALTEPVVAEALKSRIIGGVSGAVSGGVQSIATSLIYGRSFGEAGIDLGKSVVIGGVSGAAFNIKAGALS